MKILNLYAGIGGNRKLWGDSHDITAVEINQEIAGIYKTLFPKDNVIIGDAHQYLVDNYKEYDFIWSSPPCQTHSRARQNLGVKSGKSKAVYADMNLYQEIIFLRYNFGGKYVVENVIPYYEPLIKPNKIIDRHYFWTNLLIYNNGYNTPLIIKSTQKQLQEAYGFNLENVAIFNKKQILRNCVNPKLGLHIFNSIANEGLV